MFKFKVIQSNYILILICKNKIITDKIYLLHKSKNQGALILFTMINISNQTKNPFN